MLEGPVGTAHTSGSLPQLPDQDPGPISEAFKEPPDQKRCYGGYLEGKGEGNLRVIWSSLASKIIERACRLACPWVSLGPCGHFQGSN